MKVQQNRLVKSSLTKRVRRKLFIRELIHHVLERRFVIIQNFTIVCFFLVGACVRIYKILQRNATFLLVTLFFYLHYRNVQYCSVSCFVCVLCVFCVCFVFVLCCVRLFIKKIVLSS
jgi:hypothetical protein